MVYALQIKSSPEDFLVREFYVPKFAAGNYALYSLRKERWNTEDVLQELSRLMQVPRKALASCGNKDRQAITEQYITAHKGAPRSYFGKDFSLTYLGQMQEALHLGAHERNIFTITLRGLKPDCKVLTSKVRNTFGEQRFGQGNEIVGFHLLRKDYRAAAEALKLTFTNDPITALRTVPKQLLTLYLHAAQSMLWNERVKTLAPTVTSYLLPGYGEPLDDEMLALLSTQSLEEDCFINRSMHELSLEGGARQVYQDVQDFSASTVKDGVMILQFSLPPSQYATETVRQKISE